MAIELKFWGVRGSTPTPVAENLGYGGNTACMEITGGQGERIIVDAGTGIRGLGQLISADKQAQEIDILLTHFHWDHIQGLPFFGPLLRPENKISFHSFPSAGEIEARLERQMSDPYFTLEFNRVGAKREFHHVDKTFSLSPHSRSITRKVHSATGLSARARQSSLPPIGNTAIRI